MAFRERIKKALRKASPNSSVSKSSTSDSKEGRERWPSNVYKPGEPMPRPKYRAPVKKEHKEKLESFSFASAWRRKSFMSEYSPMGTRMPSRRTSLISRKSFGGRSSLRNSMNMSRRNSVSGGVKSGRESLEVPRERHAALAPALSTEVEAYGDDDVTNGMYHTTRIQDETGLTIISSRSFSSTVKRRQTASSCIFTTPDRRIAIKSSGKSITVRTDHGSTYVHTNASAAKSCVCSRSHTIHRRRAGQSATTQSPGNISSLRMSRNWIIRRFGHVFGHGYTHRIWITHSF